MGTINHSIIGNHVPGLIANQKQNFDSKTTQSYHKSGTITKTKKGDFAQILNNQNPTVKNSEIKRASDGTDIALRQLAIEFENTFKALLWNQVAGSSSAFSSEAEKVFSTDLMNERIKMLSNEEMGEIATQIYNEEVRKNKNAAISIQGEPNTSE